MDFLVLPISCLTCFPPGANTSPATAIGATSQLSSQKSLSSAHNDYFDQPSVPRDRPSSEPHTRHPSFSRRSQAPPSPPKSGLLDQRLQRQRDRPSITAPPIKTADLPSPLESPRSPTYLVGCFSKSLGNSEGAKRDRDGPASSSTDNCPNCSLSIPKSLSEKLPEGAPGSPTHDGRIKNGSPVLRTREALIARGFGNNGTLAFSPRDLINLENNQAPVWRPSLPASQRTITNVKRSIHEDDSLRSASPRSHARSVMNDKGDNSTKDDSHKVEYDEDELSPIPPSTSSSCSSSVHYPDRSHTSTFATSFPSTPPATPPAHEHMLTYLSTRQPSSLDAHSLLRRSCIRTLSCEQLPRTHSGPLFFGDDESGYTISFVFRLPDPCARGRVRRYAFIAWAGHDERRAARAYKDVLQAFAGMASRIVDMVEKREAAAAAAAAVAIAESASSNNNGIPTTYVDSNKRSRDSASISSFLSGRSMDPDGFRRRSDVRAKGLAELVDKEDIFVDMHAAFVHLLAQLGRSLGGWPMGSIVDSGIRGEVGEIGRPSDRAILESVEEMQVKMEESRLSSGTAREDISAVAAASEEPHFKMLPQPAKRSGKRHDDKKTSDDVSSAPISVALQKSGTTSGMPRYSATQTLLASSSTLASTNSDKGNNTIEPSLKSSARPSPAHTTSSASLASCPSASSSPLPGSTTPNPTQGLTVRANSPLQPAVSRRQIAV